MGTSHLQASNGGGEGFPSLSSFLTALSSSFWVLPTFTSPKKRGGGEEKELLSVTFAHKSRFHPSPYRQGGAEGNCTEPFFFSPLFSRRRKFVYYITQNPRLNHHIYETCQRRRRGRGSLVKFMTFSLPSAIHILVFFRRDTLPVGK